MGRKKIIEDIEYGVLMARTTSTKLVHLPVDKAEDIVELLKEQEDKIRQLRLALQILNGNGIKVDTEGR